MYNEEFTAGARAQVTPDEIDQYVYYQVDTPGTSHTAIGTAAVGTSTTSQAFVITNLRPDFPRNLLVDISGSNDIGGTATINGFDFFGSPQTEKIGFGTVVSPGTQASGTLVFAQVTSGTFQFATGSAGSGTPKLGYASGTANAQGTALGNLFGLPTKIRQLADVKLFTWGNNGVTTGIFGGTIGTSALFGTANHTFRGTAAIATTDTYTLMIKPTWDNSSRARNLASLPGTP